MAKRPVSSKLEGKVPKSSKFNFDFEDDNFKEIKKGYVPKNTDLETKKCMRLFEEWAKQRNNRHPNEPVPSHILDEKDQVALCTWLCKLCVEVRKADGTQFPPRSIHHYVASVQRFIRTKDGSEKLNIFTDPEFIPQVAFPRQWLLIQANQSSH